MLLEAFFSTVASNVFTEIFKRVTGNKPLKAEDIKRIIVDTLHSQHIVSQTQAYEREIIIVLNGAGVVDAGGKFLPSSHNLPAPGELIRAWWYEREYKIVSVYTEKVIDAPRNEDQTGLPLILWDYHGGKNQQWKIIPVGDAADLFKIHSPYSSMVLDVPEPRMDNGTQIIQFGYHGGTNQQWRLRPIDRNSEVFKITSEWSGKSLDAPNSRMDNGAPLVQWGYHGGTNQQWRLERVK